MTDFIEWLDANEPDNFEEVYGLYRAAQEGGNWGPYEAKADERGRVFIKGSDGVYLALLSEKAKSAFVRLIQRRYMDGDGPDAMSPEGWYGFMIAMSKEDKEQ